MERIQHTRPHHLARVRCLAALNSIVGTCVVTAGSPAPDALAQLMVTVPSLWTFLH